jgi:hypothetical protein
MTGRHRIRPLSDSLPGIHIKIRTKQFGMFVQCKLSKKPDRKLMSQHELGFGSDSDASCCRRFEV